MKPGKTEVKKIMAVLDQDHETLEDAARACIEACWDEYEKRAKFIIAGQVRFSNGYLDADDVKAARVAMGPFPTRLQAEKAGQSLAYSYSTGEQAKWGAFPLWRDTPAKWYTERKKARDLRESAGDVRPGELRRRYQEEWLSAHPGQALPEHLSGSGWDGLDNFMQWREEHINQCPYCNGTGKVDG